jgi:hypothetical protein
MKRPSFIDDIQDVRLNWRDADYKAGFIRGFASTFIPRFFVSFFVGFLVVAAIFIAT